MGYGAILSCRSFVAMSFGRQEVSEIWRPQRGDETSVAFSFMLCLSVGLAVACLGGFHLYLLLTAQTTIEFHGECRPNRLILLCCSFVNPSFHSTYNFRSRDIDRQLLEQKKSKAAGHDVEESLLFGCKAKLATSLRNKTPACSSFAVVTRARVLANTHLGKGCPKTADIEKRRQ